MNKLSVILYLLAFGLTAGSQAHAAESRAKSFTIKLPAYNPLRERIPSTPQAQKLHKKILQVRKNLTILRAVPLNDPSVEPRLKKIIEKKIVVISEKLAVLEADMKQRIAQANSIQANSSEEKIKPQSQRKPVKQKPTSALGGAREQKGLKKKDISHDTSSEIKALKNSLQEIVAKLDLLERRTKADMQQETRVKTAIKPRQDRPQKRKSGFIPLPVARQAPLRAPKLVQTQIVYPSLVNRQGNAGNGMRLIGLRGTQLSVEAQTGGMLLPVAKPDIGPKHNKSNTRYTPKNSRGQAKKSGQKYASVEDVDGQDQKWSDAAVFKAANQCTSLFKKLNIDYVEKPPIKNGRCGTPAPILLRGFGNKKHQVKISPPATINCKATAVLAKWMNKKIQPVALKLLGSPIAKIHNVASYNCRNRYGRKYGRISEHAYANALDIMAFTTKKGEKVDVLKHFYGEDEKGVFLRAVHKIACKDKFGTVLGPDANAAHKNHFHLDLAKRRRSAYCE